MEKKDNNQIVDKNLLPEDSKNISLDTQGFSEPTQDKQVIKIPDNEIITAADLLSLDIPATPHVFPGIIPQGLSILAGKPKKGKSWFCLNLACSIAYGLKFLDQTPEPKQVLYIALEDNHSRMKERLSAVLANNVNPQNRNLHLIFKWPRINEGGKGKLDKYLQDNPDVKLVILDTWAMIRGTKRNGSTLYDKDYREFVELKSIADKHGIGILVVHHLRKTDSKDTFDMVLGSNGSTGASDNIILLTQEKRGADTVLEISSRALKPQTLAVKFDLQTSWWKILGKPAEEYQISQEQQEILEFFKKEQEDDPLKLANVAEFLGKKKPNVYKLMNKLVEKKLLEKTGFGKYQLKTEEDKLATAKWVSPKLTGEDCKIKPTLMLISNNDCFKEGD